MVILNPKIQTRIQSQMFLRELLGFGKCIKMYEMSCYHKIIKSFFLLVDLVYHILSMVDVYDLKKKGGHV